MSHYSGWTLNKWLVLLLTGAFLGLTIDLRYEHVDKVRRFWEAWIPIAYSGVMVIVCLVCLFLWERRGRVVLFCAFTLSLVVGIAGFWLHNKSHLLPNIAAVLEAWAGLERHKDIPPVLAPLAFCGLGLLGMLTCYEIKTPALSLAPSDKPVQ